MTNGNVEVKAATVGTVNTVSRSSKSIHHLAAAGVLSAAAYVLMLIELPLPMIMPTFFGPTNIPPLEAMFMGCPLAVSDVYAMAEQVGDAALLFDPKSVESIASAIRRLWEDDELCKRLSEKGRQRSALFSRERYNERFAKNLEDILRKLRDTAAWQERFLGKCHSEHLYLYGAGRYSYLTAAYLLMHHVDIEGFLVTSAENNPGAFLGRPVVACDALDLSDGETPHVLVALTKRYQKDVLATLERAQISDRAILQDEDIQNIMKAFASPQGQNFIRRLRVK